MAPTARRVEGSSALSRSGASLAIHEMTKVSNHRSPPSSIVPTIAVTKAIGPSLARRLVEPPPVRADQGEHEHTKANKVNDIAGLKYRIRRGGHVIVGI